MLDDSRFAEAISLFDAENAKDPRKKWDGQAERAYELVLAERLSAWVVRLEPDASEALRLAARCQHLKRWEVPRQSYPEGRIGYLRWRSDLARFHADASAKILTQLGYDSETLQAVRRINLKQGIGREPETSTMEDALCLVFLEEEAGEFAAKHPDEKVVEILRKTWRKMSARGREAALALNLPERLQTLLRVALG